MAYAKRITATVHRTSSRTKTEIELTGRVSQGPAGTVDRNVSFLVPNDDADYVIESIATWKAMPFSSSVDTYFSSYDRKSLAADYLRQLATKLEDRA